MPLVTFYPTYTDHALSFTKDPDLDWKLFRVCLTSERRSSHAIAFNTRALFIVHKLED